MVNLDLTGIGTALGSNYQIASGVGQITPYLVNNVAGIRAYDSSSLFNTNASGLGVASFKTVTGANGEQLTVGTVANTTGATVSSPNVGTYALGTLGNLTLTGIGSVLASNYQIVGGTGQITPFLVNNVFGIRAYDSSNLFNTNASGLGVASFQTVIGVNGEQLTVGTVTNTTGATVSSPNVGTYALGTLGNLTLTGIGTALASNYQIASGVGQITPFLVNNVTATRNYDGSTLFNTNGSGPGVATFATVKGVNGETLNVASSGSGATVSSPNVGGYQLGSLGNLSLVGNGSTLGSNYQIVGGTGTINPLPVNISATRVYNGLTSITGGLFNINNLVSGDSLTLGGSATAGSRNVGVYTTNAGSLSTAGLTLIGGSAGNYTLVNGIGTGTITPASLTLAAVPNTKTYDGTTNSSGVPTVTGLVTGDGVTSLSQSFDSKNAGPRILSVNPGYNVNDGNGGNNYKVTLVTANGLINPAPLIITTTDVTKTYDGNTTANGQVTVIGGTVFPGDSKTGGNFAYTNKNAGIGDKTVTVSGVTVGDGINNGNYVITYVYNTTSTINPAVLNLTAVSDSKYYDGNTSSSKTPVVVGLVSGDSIGGLSQAFDSPKTGNRTLLVNPNYLVNDGNGGNNYTYNIGTAPGIIYSVAGPGAGEIEPKYGYRYAMWNATSGMNPLMSYNLSEVSDLGDSVFQNIPNDVVNNGSTTGGVPGTFGASLNNGIQAATTCPGVDEYLIQDGRLRTCERREQYKAGRKIQTFQWPLNPGRIPRRPRAY